MTKSEIIAKLSGIASEAARNGDMDRFQRAYRQMYRMKFPSLPGDAA